MRRNGLKHAASKSVLLNAESACFFHGDRQLLKQFLEGRVRRQVQTIEARVSPATTITENDSSAISHKSSD